MGGGSGHDAALADMIQGLRDDAVNRGVTALMDEEVSTLGVPDPRILIVGCGGSGNNTLNRITHLGVEGAVTVAINTDKQHLDHTRALQKPCSSSDATSPEAWVQVVIHRLDDAVRKPVVR